MTRLRLAITAAFLVAAAIAIATTREPGPPFLTDLMARTIETRGVDAAAAQYRALRAQGFAGVRESNSDTNSLGYRLLRRGDHQGAIQVFKLNTESHPASSNAHDSLGEAYLAAGHPALAIEAYRKAVALNPRKKTAIRALQELTSSERPARKPLALFHIVAGLLGIVSGAAAISLPKGSRPHALAGNVFFTSMASMSLTGAFMAFVDPEGETINILMGTFTFYLVTTAWLTARRRTGGTSIVERAALLVALAVSAGLFTHGVSTGNNFKRPVCFIFGSIALLAAALDLRLILRGGVSGAARIVRHLWRMCCALFIAVTSLFLGQPQLFSPTLRRSGALALPSALVVLALLFWLGRFLLGKRYRRKFSESGLRPSMPVGSAALG